MRTILIVDDESTLREFIGVYFKANGYVVYEAASGSEAMKVFQEHKIDLILLDILMPDEDGIQVCRKFRAISDVPIVFLTALQQNLSAMEAYDAGGDDYIVKDANPKLIVAKVNRMFERLVPNSSIIKLAGITVDLEAAEVHCGEREISLTYREFLILKLLMENPKKVFSREDIIASVWSDYEEKDPRIVDTHIKNLRKKLGSEGKAISTVFSRGYKFDY